MTQSDATVLLIDDNKALREALTLAVEETGFKVHPVDSAVAAREWLAKHIPAMILVDIMMPDLNGLEFCRWVRGSPRFAVIPIIMMSALKDEETIQDAMELGVIDFLKKPFPLKVLKEKVGRFLPKPR